MEHCKVCDTGEIEYMSVQMGGDGDPIVDGPDVGLCFDCGTDYDEDGNIVRVNQWGDVLPVILSELRGEWQASDSKKAQAKFLSEKAG